MPGSRWLAGLSLVLLVTAAAAASPPGASPEGNWLTEKQDGIVEIYRCAGDQLCGKVAWFRMRPSDPNPEARDIRNPDPALRRRPLCGLTFMTGFRQTEPGHWEDGAIYDPESGNTYHGTIKLQADGTLRLHGYIGISLLGRSEVWTRFTKPIPSCPTW